jgi:hypothetical protein
MREIRTYGSSGGGRGNTDAYPTELSMAPRVRFNVEPSLAPRRSLSQHWNRRSRPPTTRVRPLKSFPSAR